MRYICKTIYLPYRIELTISFSGGKECLKAEYHRTIDQTFKLTSDFPVSFLKKALLFTVATELMLSEKVY